MTPVPAETHAWQKYLLLFFFSQSVIRVALSGMMFCCGSEFTQVRSRASAQPSSRILVEVELSDWTGPCANGGAEAVRFA